MRGAMTGLALAALLPSDAPAQLYDLARVAHTGDPAPGTSGHFTTAGPTMAFGGPGEFAFAASWDGPTPGSGIFPASGGVVSAPLVSSLDVAPGTGGASFRDFFELDRNAAGTLVFYATYGAGSLSEQGLFRLEGSSLTAVALVGDPAPGTGGGSYAGFASLTSRSLAASGEIAFHATLAGGSAPQGIFRTSGSSVVPVALVGDPAPTGGTWTGFDGAPRIDDQGRVLFVGSTLPGAEQVARAPVAGPAATLVGEDGGCLPSLAHPCLTNLADPTPNGDGELVFFGEIVFSATLPLVGEGIFQPAPPVPVGFADALGPLPSPPGETWLTGPPNGLNGDRAIAYTATVVDDNLEVIGYASVVKTRRWHLPVARTGDPAPGGGTFGWLFTMDLSDDGVVLFFSGNLQNSGSIDTGVFTATPVGPVPTLSPIALAALALLLLAGAGRALRRAAACA